MICQTIASYTANAAASWPSKPSSPFIRTMLRRSYDDLTFGEFYTCGRNDVEWGPFYTHRSIGEGPLIGDLELDKDQLAELDKAHAEPTRANTREQTRIYRQRVRDDDGAAFLDKSLAQHKAWSQSNPGESMRSPPTSSKRR